MTTGRALAVEALRPATPPSPRHDGVKAIDDDVHSWFTAPTYPRGHESGLKLTGSWDLRWEVMSATRR